MVVTLCAWNLVYMHVHINYLCIIIFFVNLYTMFSMYCTSCIGGNVSSRSSDSSDNNNIGLIAGIASAIAVILVVMIIMIIICIIVCLKKKGSYCHINNKNYLHTHVYSSFGCRSNLL